MLELTQEGLATGLTPETMLFDALIPSLEEVGARFERGDFFVPEMLVAGRAMSGALDLLRPLLAETGAQTVGTFLMGTVKGDVHDIGKNLVNIMLEGAGFHVIDLGVQVVAGEGHRRRSTSTSPTSSASPRSSPRRCRCSRPTSTRCRRPGLRDQVIVMVGGAPVTQEYADAVGRRRLRRRRRHRGPQAPRTCSRRAAPRDLGVCLMARAAVSQHTVLRSATREVVIGADQPFCIIGERINPTGRQDLQEQLRARRPVARRGRRRTQQVAGGATMLDVNMGVPLTDEAELLAHAVKIVQEL